MNTQPQFTLEQEYDLAYDEIVRPQLVVVVPGYFARRHLPILGPDLAWMYLGFRQAAYSAGGRAGQKSARFSGKEVAEMSGIVERTFWYRAGKAETWEKLRGLVTARTTEKPEWDSSSETPKRLPRHYSVAMSLPLTAADARSLRGWIEKRMEAGAGIEQALKDAASASLNELLSAQTAADEEGKPETVSAIVRDLGRALPAERQASLATSLQKHIMPDRDIISVSHFFIRHILPHLGTGPGWALTLLRDRCWSDPETGETRNVVTVSGGYAEIAEWLGLSRPMTVYEWLNGKHAKRRARDSQRRGGRQGSEVGDWMNPIFRMYVRQTDAGRTGAGSGFTASPRVFEVLQDEVPAELLEAALRGNLGELANLSIQAVPLSDYAVCSIGLTRFAVSPDFRPLQTKLTSFADEIYVNCRVLSSLSSKALKSMGASAPARVSEPEPEPEAETKAVVETQEPETKAVVETQEPEAPTKAVAETQARADNFPQDCREGARLMFDLFRVIAPQRPAPNEKGGDYALWVKGLRELAQTAAAYDASLAYAMKQTRDRWNQSPFTVSHPAALKKTMTGALAQSALRSQVVLTAIPANDWRRQIRL